MWLSVGPQARSANNFSSGSNRKDACQQRTGDLICSDYVSRDVQFSSSKVSVGKSAWSFKDKLSCPFSQDNKQFQGATFQMNLFLWIPGSCNLLWDWCCQLCGGQLNCRLARRTRSIWSVRFGSYKQTGGLFRVKRLQILTSIIIFD